VKIQAWGTRDDRIGKAQEMMRNITCERCGAEYEIIEHRTPVSAQNSFQCNCGETLMRHKEVVFYNFKLIKLGEEPEKK
jgi:NAD-dependent SIR2 family protein deacetylase